MRIKSTLCLRKEGFTMWTEAILDKKLSTPSQKLIADIAAIEGDIMILGAGGKMGPSLCLLAKRAADSAGISKRIIAVSRFSDPIATKLLVDNEIETISMDMMEPGQVDTLPDCENIIYMAGRKFGTDGQEYLTWAMNAWLPSLVAEKFRNSRIVVFSSGNIYPIVPLATGGCTEEMRVVPAGEYAMSCLARERMFEYASKTYGTSTFVYRLNFAVDLRYGVLYDIASKILSGGAISVETPVFNCIWQGDANEIAIRALLHTTSPGNIVNVTGPEMVSVKYAANRLGALLGREPIFSGTEQSDAYISNAAKSAALFGYPTVGIETLIEWQAQWIQSGGRALGKATHFEQRKGSY